jgi:hypothetical protein
MCMLATSYFNEFIRIVLTPNFVVGIVGLT